MPDLFVLSKLGSPVMVEGVDYQVWWDCDNNRAVILTIEGDGELQEMKDALDHPMSFGSELDAHRYLVGFRTEKMGEGDNSWRNID